jgi:two-component system, response regulator
MASEKVDILLVEDNLDDAELAIRAFRKSGVLPNLIHLKDGEEALDYIFCKGEYLHRDITDFPRVICLDLKMPKVDGMEVLSKVKSDERTKSIPVVMLTSSKEDKDIRETYRLGVNSYVVKPVTFDEYIKTVSELGSYWLILNE